MWYTLKSYAAYGALSKVTMLVHNDADDGNDDDADEMMMTVQKMEDEEEWF